MAYRFPGQKSLTSPAAVKALVEGMESGQERVTKIPANDLLQKRAFRSALCQYFKGQYLTTATKGDGWLWVLKL